MYYDLGLDLHDQISILMVSLTKSDKAFAVQDIAFHHQVDSNSFDLNNFSKNNFFLQILEHQVLEITFEQSCPKVLLVYTEQMGIAEHDPGHIFEDEHMKLDKRRVFVIRNLVLLL